MSKTRKRPFIFVLMPFTDELEDSYESGIRLACESVELDCARVDEQDFDQNQTILQQIYDQIRSADAIVANMTGRNPNVFYEVGFAHAHDKPVILVTESAADIPFDLKHHQHIIYEGKAFLLREKLAKKLISYFPPSSDADDSETSSPTVRRITRILAHVSKAVGEQAELQQLLDTVVEEMMEIFDAEVCAIFLNSEEEQDTIRCVAGSGFAKPLVGNAFYNLGEGLTGTVFKLQKTFLIGSSEELLKQKRSEWRGKYDKEQWAPFGGVSQYRNGIVTPLAIGGQVLGVLKIENKRAGTFTTDDLAVLEAITTGVLSLAVYNARARKIEQQI